MKRMDTILPGHADEDGMHGPCRHLATELLWCRLRTICPEEVDALHQCHSSSSSTATVECHNESRALDACVTMHATGAST